VHTWSPLSVLSLFMWLNQPKPLCFVMWFSARCTCLLLCALLYPAPPCYPVQVPTMLMSGFLLFRALALAAANLTVNEWLNRHRYVYLHYTGAGFSNRFDRGIATNCYDFWCGPKFVDYWDAWDTAEEVRLCLGAATGQISAETPPGYCCQMHSCISCACAWLTLFRLDRASKAARFV